MTLAALLESETDFDPIDEALVESASTFRSPRMFDAGDTSAIVGSRS